MSSGIIDKNNTYLNRRSIRLKGFDYTKQGAYFITICTNNRDNLFGEIVSDKIILNEYGEIANAVWKKIPNHFPNVELDEYIIMPNHVHGIIVIEGNNVGVIDYSVGAIHELPLQETTLPQQKDFVANRIYRRKMTIPKIVGYYKMNITKQINLLRNKPGVTVWQRNYYDRIIRNDVELKIKREYIKNNPARWNEDENNPAVYKNTVKNISRD